MKHAIYAILILLICCAAIFFTIGRKSAITFPSEKLSVTILENCVDSEIITKNDVHKSWSSNTTNPSIALYGSGSCADLNNDFSQDNTGKLVTVY